MAGAVSISDRSDRQFHPSYVRYSTRKGLNSKVLCTVNTSTSLYHKDTNLPLAKIYGCCRVDEEKKPLFEESVVAKRPSSTSLTVAKFARVPKAKRRTITFDNGTDFSDWERFEKKTKMTVYFAYPYHARERGANENTNGLLRQYFPKSYDFNLIKPEDLRRVVKKLNY